MSIIAQVLKEKWLKNHGFCSFKNKEKKLVNEAANDSARVSGQDRKKSPALGTNQIAGFKGFRPLSSVEKIKLFLLFNLLITRICKIARKENMYRVFQKFVPIFSSLKFH